MERLHYFARRLLLIVPTFIGITFCCFGITQLVPGGPVEQLLAKMQGSATGEGMSISKPHAAVSADYEETLRKHFGFDKPMHVRYWRWLVTNRLGLRVYSYKFRNKTAWQLIRDRFPVSLIFGMTGFVAAYLVCIPLGISKAIRNGGVFDTCTSVLVFLGYATPAVALGMVAKVLFCGTTEHFWDIFPSFGFYSDNFDSLPPLQQAKDIFMHMLLPVCCYMIGHFAVLTILMKNSLLDQIGSDYIRTVLAKGGSRRRAIWCHAFRNSLIPIATGFGAVLTVMFAGSVIIERIFEIPGMGRLSLDAIVTRDYAVFMGIVSITSLLGLLGNIVSDLCYVLIDPRINFQR